LNIVILSQYFYPETGAPQNRLLELVNGLKNRGWNVSVITAMPNYPRGKIFKNYKYKIISKENENGIDIHRYWLYASNSADSIPRIFSMLSFSFTSLFSLFSVKSFKPDFFFVESPPLTLAYSAYLLSRITKSKLVMNVSDIWPLSAKELGKINEGYFYKKLEGLEKFLYKKSFLCTGQSEEIIGHIKKSGGKNVYLFRNGVSISRFKRNNSIEDNDKIKIVYAGLLGVAQGIYGIVRNINFKGLDTEFHIYGEGAEREDIENYLKENPARNIFLHKTVSRDEIPDLLSEFYCTIIPLVKNIYGAVPSKIYEAMAAGVPVLFSGSGEGAKIIESNKVGLVSGPQDYEALKKNILKIKSSHELRKELSDNCRRVAEEKFDRKKLIDDFAEKLEHSFEGKN
jgi:glycosyltransferase involved in cell wall biosynthesis